MRIYPEYIQYILDLYAANGTEVPYEGWIGVEFSLPANKDSELLVPLLVTTSSFAKPILLKNSHRSTCIPTK